MYVTIGLLSDVSRPRGILRSLAQEVGGPSHLCCMYSLVLTLPEHVCQGARRGPQRAQVC
jgi:hypothetical protein